MDTLISYNILADCYLPVEKFPHLTSVPQPSARAQAVIEIVKSADVICLQEIEPRTFDTLYATLLLTHDYAIQSYNPKKAIACVTLWKKEHPRPQVTITSCSVICRWPTLTVVNLHLKAGLRTGKTMRSQQAASITRRLADDRNVVIVGDYNDTDPASLFPSYAVRSAPAWTCYIPPDEYQHFDYCLSNMAVSVAHSSIEKGPLPNMEYTSDHLPMYVTLL